MGDVPIDALEHAQLVALDVEGEQVDFGVAPGRQGVARGAAVHVHLTHVQSALSREAGPVQVHVVLVALDDAAQPFGTPERRGERRIADAALGQRALALAGERVEVAGQRLDAEPGPAEALLVEVGVAVEHGLVGGDVEEHAGPVEVAEVLGVRLHVLVVAAEERGRAVRAQHAVHRRAAARAQRARPRDQARAPRRRRGVRRLLRRQPVGPVLGHGGGDRRRRTLALGHHRRRPRDLRLPQRHQRHQRRDDEQKREYLARRHRDCACAARACAACALVVHHSRRISCCETGPVETDENVSCYAREVVQRTRRILSCCLSGIRKVSSKLDDENSLTGLPIARIVYLVACLPPGPRHPYPIAI